LIELADVIRQLRVELDRARTAGEGEDLRFELGPIEMEVSVELQAEGGGGAKVRFWVVEVGGDARATSASTQRVKLTLHPTTGPGTTAHGAVRRPYVSGSDDEGER
jgi:hypothetical protein